MVVRSESSRALVIAVLQDELRCCYAIESSFLPPCGGEDGVCSAIPSNWVSEILPVRRTYLRCPLYLVGQAGRRRPPNLDGMVDVEFEGAHSQPDGGSVDLVN